MARHLQHGDSGHLLYGGAGHLSNDAGPPPDTCPGEVNDHYRIVDLTSLGACPTCVTECENVEDWDGNFTIAPFVAPCVWLAKNQNGFGWHEDECLRLDDVDLVNTVIVLDTNADCWRISLRCKTSSGDDFIWNGCKTTGQTPVGYYTRDWGCSTVPTLHVV